MSLRKSLSIAVALLGVAAMGSQAKAAFTVVFQQEGGNVVATGSGTLNTSGLSILANRGGGAYVFPEYAAWYVGTPSPTDEYTGAISGPGSFGGGTGALATSGSGDSVGEVNGEIYIQQGYISGNPFSDSSTYDSATFDSLGITPGTYTWSWGSGDTADSLTLETESTPEPASLALLGFGVIGLLARRRRNA